MIRDLNFRDVAKKGKIEIRGNKKILVLEEDYPSTR